MTYLDKLIFVVMLLALSGCQRSTSSPTLLDCYQSGELSFRLKKDRLFVDRNISSEFALNKRKIGWAISSYFLIIKKENGDYGFIKTDDGPYDWVIPDPNVDIVKVVSQDGIPFYFGRCLISKKDY